MPPRGNRNKKVKKLDSNAPQASSSTMIFDVEDLVAAPAEKRIHTFVDRAAPDGRSYVRETVSLNPPSPMKLARLSNRDTPTMSTSSNAPRAAIDRDPWEAERYSMSNDGDDDPPLPPLPKNPKRHQPAVRFHFPFLSFFLFWLLTEILLTGQSYGPLDVLVARPFPDPAPAT
jgi:hypothetical protein